MNNILTENLIILDTENGPRVHFHSITFYRITNQQILAPHRGYVNKKFIPLQFPGFENIDIIKVYQQGNYFLFIDIYGHVYYVNFIEDFNINQIKHVDINFKVIDLTICELTINSPLCNTCFILQDENHDLWLYRLLGGEIEPIVVDVPKIEKLCPAPAGSFIATDFNKIYIFSFNMTKFSVKTINVHYKIIQLTSSGNINNSDKFYIVYLTENKNLYYLNRHGHRKLASEVKVLSAGDKKCIIDKNNALKHLRITVSGTLFQKTWIVNVKRENIMSCTRSIMINQDGRIYTIFGYPIQNIPNAYIPLNH